MPAFTAHVVRIYRRVRTGTTAYREQTTGWVEVAAGVPCDLQPRTGDVGQEQYGRERSERRRGFFPTGTDLRVDDGVVVTSGSGPARYLVTLVADWGPPGDLEAELEETTETFP
ncbi:MAG TPA: hypothetical protein VF170_10860 [Planctomycetaceae bacterium]